MGKAKGNFIRFIGGFLFAISVSDVHAVSSGGVDAHGIWEAPDSAPVALGPERCGPMQKIIQIALNRMQSTEQFRKEVDEKCDGIGTDGVGSLPPGRSGTRGVGSLPPGRPISRGVGSLPPGRQISRGVGSLPPGRKGQSCPLTVQSTHNGIVIRWDDPEEIQKWSENLRPWVILRNLVKPGVYVQQTNCPSINGLRPEQR